ncbi:trafficking PGA2 [Xylariales sp. AK1849]|nr:trafficking PGA2 [Xylariales sp. AK1849]
MSEIQDLFAHLWDTVGQLFGIVGIAGERFATNLTTSFTSMSLKHWIRVIMVVGAYLLARPYIIKLAGKQQEKQFEKERQEDEANAAKISPNQLRGEMDLPGDSDSDDENATASTTASDWGKKARKRQRVMLKKLIDAEEKRLQDLQEDEEDKDIAQYLVG